METARRNQLINTLTTDYIQNLMNPHTDMINEAIPAIFTFLQITYGQLTFRQLRAREDKLMDLIHDVKKDTQLVFYAYMIFQKTVFFTNTLKDWN